MQPALDALIFLVDDDASVREAMAWLLRSRSLPSENFDSAESFWHRLETMTPAEHDLARCLLLDVRMPGTSGIELFDRLCAHERIEEMPVIFLTGHADVPTAVDLVKRGAFDFCEKPSSDNALVDRIERAVAQSHAAIAQRHARARITGLVAELSDRERDVMNCVVSGLPNKLIAEQLTISVRTVEVHRARVFDKMSVKSAVELANLLRAG